MEMHQVRYFLALARVLNFTRAAEECNVAQPSLTRAIKQLEEEFGHELFRRERSLTHLTDFGRRMMPFLQQCYDSAVAAKALASSLNKGAVSPLSLAITRSINLSLIISHLREVNHAFSGLELNVLRGARDDVLGRLKLGETDIVLAELLTEPWERLESWSLFTEPVHVVVSKTHRLVRGNDVKPGDFDGELLVIRAPCEANEEFMNFLRSRKVHPRILHKAVSEQDYLLLIEASFGVGLMPESAVRGRSLARLPVTGLDLKRTVYLYAVAGRQRSPVAGTFMKLLRSTDWAAKIDGHSA